MSGTGSEKKGDVKRGMEVGCGGQWGGGGGVGVGGGGVGVGGGGGGGSAGLEKQGSTRHDDR